MTVSSEGPSADELPGLFEAKELDFLPQEWIDAAKSESESKFHAAWKVYGRIHYLPYECPGCGACGAFRWGFLGKLTHAGCGTSWHVRSLEYVGMRMRKATRGFGGFAETLFGIALLIFIELPVILVFFVPIQAVAQLGDSPAKYAEAVVGSQHTPGRVPEATSGGRTSRAPRNRLALVLTLAIPLLVASFLGWRMLAGRSLPTVLSAMTSSATGDQLVGDWGCDEDAVRFVSIRKNGDGYLWTDNEGTYPATYRDGMMTVNGRPGVAYDEASRRMTCARMCNCERFRRAGDGTGSVETFVRLRRTYEATWSISRIYQREISLFNQSNTFASAPATPATPPTASGYPPSPTLWSDPGWRSLGFSIDFTQHYQYRVEADARSFTITAVGDLDGDGVFSTFQRGAALVGTDQIQGTLIRITNELE